MKLKFITCSGLNEKNDIGDVARAAYFYPKMEIGIQVSGKKCSLGTPRYEWLEELQEFLLERKMQINLALHLNSDWVEQFCAGKTPQELKNLLEMRDNLGNPRFGRIQLNFKIGRDKVPSEDVLLSVLENYSIPGRRFIVSHNEANAAYLENIFENFKELDCLYDNSFGEGILTERKKPCFGDNQTVQGYAGGLSVENIMDELEKISALLPDNAVFSIDAEGKLKENGAISLQKCESFVYKAYFWMKTFQIYHHLREPCV